MTDFSHHGGISPEWTELTKTVHVPRSVGLPPGMTNEQYQSTVNTGREDSSATYMKSSHASGHLLIKDYTILTRDGSSIPIRTYQPKNTEGQTLPVYLFYHGGGFIFGTLDSENANCARIARAVPIIVASVCYRHTPQVRHPTHLHDAQDAWRWLLDHISELGGDRDRIVVGGTSAGAALASAIVLRQRDVQLRGQILCIPWLVHPRDRNGESASYAENEDAPILPRAQLDHFTELLGQDDPSDTSLFVVGNVSDEEVKSLPKTAFLVAGRDMLRDEGLLYAEKLERAGVETKVDVFDGLPHGFYRYLELPGTDRWFETVNESLKWALAI